MNWLGESALLLLALAFGLLLRLPYSLESNSDQWGVQVKIRKHARRNWLDYRMPDSVVPGIFPYPMLVHYLVSRFPERLWKGASLLLNLGSDVLVALPVYLLLRSLLSAAPTLGGGVGHAALAGALLYLTTPILFPVTARLKNSNGRCFGLLLCTGYFLLLYPAMFRADFVAAAGCVVLALLTYISSFFAMQTVIVFSVGLALLYLNWVPLAVAVLSVGLSFLLPRLGARDTLVFKVNHFICYAHNAHKNTTATGRNLFANFFRFFKVLGRDRIEAFTLFFRTSPLLIAVYSVPAFWLLLLLWGGDASVRSALAAPFPRYCAAVVLLSFLVFLATSTGRLVIFGQAERYFEYSAPFLAVCTVLALDAGGPDRSAAFLVLLLLNLVVILFVDLAYEKRFFRALRQGPISGDEEDRDMVERLRALGRPLRIATVPIKLPMLLSAFAEDADPISYYYRLIMKDLRLDGFRDFTEDSDDMNVFAGTPAGLARKYGISHVLCQKNYLRRTEFGFIAELLKLPLVAENGRYALFSVDPAALGEDGARQPGDQRPEAGQA